MIRLCLEQMVKPVASLQVEGRGKEGLGNRRPVFKGARRVRARVLHLSGAVTDEAMLGPRPVIIRALLLSGVMILSASSNANAGQTAVIPVPDWAFDVDRIDSKELKSVSFSYAGDSDRAVQWSREVLNCMGYSECVTDTVGWHDFSALRRGNGTRTHRLVKFAFRAEPPSIATIEATEGPLYHTLLFQLRQLPTSDLVQAERELLCGQ